MKKAWDAYAFHAFVDQYVFYSVLSSVGEDSVVCSVDGAVGATVVGGIVVDGSVEGDVFFSDFVDFFVIYVLEYVPSV